MQTYDSRKQQGSMVRRLVLAAILTAIVVVLQMLSVLLRPIFPMFTISLVLIPIVIGVALVDWWAGPWLGLVFGVTVLISGDANVFLGVNAFGTVLTVLLKGVLAGLAAGLVYNLLIKVNDVVATVAAAVICPVVNTGVFILGCRLFFWDTLQTWKIGTEHEGMSVFVYLLLIVIGSNFLIELAINCILSPIVVRLVNIYHKNH